MPDRVHGELFALSDASIFATVTGNGPPLLLLHGFPETHLMWRDIARLLASRFTVVCADLRGYGASSCPSTVSDPLAYSKRAMAKDMIELMAKVGFDHFMVCGHDRGGRVAYRMALDHSGLIEKLAVLDIVPTDDSWNRADDRFALAFWPWSLLAQSPPLPERLIVGAPEAVIDQALEGWGSSATAFPPEVKRAYVQALSDPDHVHAICEEYRAAASIDREHDAEDRIADRKIDCPMLALWSATGALAEWYASEGGPLALWRQWSDKVEGCAVLGGHFFPEEHPRDTAETLARFFGGPGTAL